MPEREKKGKAWTLALLYGQWWFKLLFSIKDLPCHPEFSVIPACF